MNSRMISGGACLLVLSLGMSNLEAQEDGGASAEEIAQQDLGIRQAEVCNDILPNTGRGRCGEGVDHKSDRREQSDLSHRVIQPHERQKAHYHPKLGSDHPGSPRAHGQILEVIHQGPNQ